MKIISGRSHPTLAKKIAELTNGEYIQTSIENFEDGELRVQVLSDLHREDVVIIQSTSKPTNDNLMELLLLIDTAQRAGARRITAVIPYFGYSRQDRRAYNYGPISASLVANLLETAGVTRVITVDLHSKQIEGFFNVPLQNIDPIDLLLPLVDISRQPIIVSPDIGGTDRAQKISSLLGMELAIINKIRNKHNECVMDEIRGEVKGRYCLLVDDIVDTGKTICKAAELLLEQGASAVDAYVTHAVLSSPAVDLIQASSIGRLYVTDTICSSKLPVKIQVVSAAELIAEQLTRGV